jgi:hypothetical protein
MRTKTLLLSAAVIAAGLATSVAQSVYSVNAVGYVNVTLSAGYNLLNNPLNGTNLNNINTVIPTAPDGTSVLTWNPTIGDFNQADVFFTGAGWLDGDGFPSQTRLQPGAGFFVQNNSGANASITFVGEVPQGLLTNSILSNYGFYGSQVPQSATLTALGFPGREGMSYNAWNKAAQDYAQAYAFTSGLWFDPDGNPNDPVPGVAEGFLITNPGGAVDWTRNFSVNN